MGGETAYYHQSAPQFHSHIAFYCYGKKKRKFTYQKRCERQTLHFNYFIQSYCFEKWPSSKMLCQQLAGYLTIKNENGFMFPISFHSLIFDDALIFMHTFR